MYVYMEVIIAEHFIGPHWPCGWFFCLMPYCYPSLLVFLLKMKLLIIFAQSSTENFSIDTVVVFRYCIYTFICLACNDNSDEKFYRLLNDTLDCWAYYIIDFVPVRIVFLINAYHYHAQILYSCKYIT